MSGWVGGGGCKQVMGLVTNYRERGGGGGRLQNGRGACEVLPLGKGRWGGRKSFSHAI